MMRGLAMDFGNDPKVRDINTQYMFGPSLLVNPVTEFSARSRDVYLPAGSDWYDVNSGEKYRGGQTIDAEAPYTRMPLFVKAGSILPTGPEIQSTAESLNTPLTLNVFTGADGRFEIYEDDGKSYGYENGEWARIPVSYDDASGQLTIGERAGNFDGMAETREIKVRWIGSGDKPFDFDSSCDETVQYSGSRITLKRG